MPKKAEGEEMKSARIVPTFTPGDRERYMAYCKATGIKYFSSHLRDIAMAEVALWEANKSFEL